VFFKGWGEEVLLVIRRSLFTSPPCDEKSITAAADLGRGRHSFLFRAAEFFV
jgi:hypothetical protein